MEWLRVKVDAKGGGGGGYVTMNQDSSLKLHRVTRSVLQSFLGNCRKGIPLEAQDVSCDRDCSLETKSQFRSEKKTVVAKLSCICRYLTNVYKRFLLRLPSSTPVAFTLSLRSLKGTFSQRFKEKWIGEDW